MYNVCYNNVGPYMGVSFDESISFKAQDRSFRVLVCGAYNAFGLIGTEHNGIVILDEDNLSVVLDRHAEQQTGYFGLSGKQVAEAKRIAQLGWDAFVVFCRQHLRCRELL